MLEITNAPDELNFAPLVEKLDEEAKCVSGMIENDFHDIIIQQLTYLFKEERTKWEQLRVDYLARDLREFFDGKLSIDN